MSYPPPPGHPPPPSGYGWYPPPRPGTAIAFVSAGLFLACGLLALVTAILSWDGSAREVEWVVALAGARSPPTSPGTSTSRSRSR